MARTEDSVRGMATEMIDALSSSLMDDNHHGLIRRYLKGQHDLPYIPPQSRAHFIATARKAVTNWLPLVSDTFVKGLWVDGYGPAGGSSPAWSWWQANGLDARQSVVHRGTLEYGAAYTMVLPGGPTPVIRALDATKSMAFYEEDDAEWPVQGIIHTGKTLTGDELYQALDGEALYDLVREADGGKLRVVTVTEHPFGFTPMVRFRERLDGDSRGIILPHIGLQDRINEAVFTLLVAIQYASFRQRWAKGLSVPIDQNPTIANPDYDSTQPEDPDANPATIPNPAYGQAIEAFEAAIDRLWVTDDKEAAFGEFGQTNTDYHIRAYESAVRTLAVLSDVPPAVLLGEMVNVSADALASMYDSTERRMGMFRTILGESWEQTFRLAGLAAGKKRAAQDRKSQVRWRDTHVRSFAAVVDGITKLVSIGFPVEAAFEKIPDSTQEDVARWVDLYRQKLQQELAQARAIASAQAAAKQQSTDSAGATNAPADTQPNG